MIIPHNKVTFDNGMTNVPVGHSVPFSSDQDEYEDIMEQVQRCVGAVKMRSSFFNTDIILHENKAYILEIGGRSGSTCIPEMLSEYCGCDYYEKMILNALGKPIDIHYTQQCACAAGFIISRKTGTVKRISAPHIESKNVTVNFDIKEGDSVREFRVGSDGIGKILCVADNLSEAEKRFREVQLTINQWLSVEET